LFGLVHVYRRVPGADAVGDADPLGLGFPVGASLNVREAFDCRLQFLGNSGLD